MVDIEVEGEDAITIIRIDAMTMAVDDIRVEEDATTTMTMEEDTTVAVVEDIEGEAVVVEEVGGEDHANLPIDSRPKRNRWIRSTP